MELQLKTFYGFLAQFKTFQPVSLKKLVLPVCLFSLLIASKASAQTFGPVDVSYYYSSCSSVFYCTGDSFPGCTDTGSPPNSPNQYIVAMNTADLGTVVQCNQCILMWNASTTIVVKVVDECPGCESLHGTHSVDLDPAAAQALDPNYLTDGIFPVSWEVDTNCALTTPTPGGPTNTPTPATPGATPNPGGVNSTQCASNCSTTPSTCMNTEDISQFVSYTGLGYGYVAASTGFTFTGTFPYPTTGSLTVAGIPAGATIVAAYLDMVGASCQTALTVNGTGFTGVETGYAPMETYFDNPYTPYNADPAAWAGWATNYCNERYTVTSAVAATGNGTYNLTFSSALEQLTANIFVVYQVPASTTTTTVTLADGLFFWGTGDGTPDVLYAGQAPIMTTLGLCAGGCASNPSAAQFTRAGGGGLENTGDAGQKGAGNDEFVSPSDALSSPNSNVLLSEPVTALGKTANDVTGGGPPYANMDTYALPDYVVGAGSTAVSWWMGNALPNWGDYDKDFFWVNALALEVSCTTPTPTPTPTNTVAKTPTPTFTNTFTKTFTNTFTPTITNTFTPTITKTFTNTFTPTITNTFTPTITKTFTNTFTPTVTNTFTPTITNTFTPTVTNTFTKTFTNTFTPTNTNTKTNTPTPTNTPTNTITPTNTNTFVNSPTPTNTFTVTPTNTNTNTPVNTPTPTNTPTNTVTPTNTNTFVNSPTPTNTPTVTPTNTNTDTPVNTATPTNTPTNTPTPTFTNTFIDSPTPTNTFTVTPTNTNTNTPIAVNTATYTNTPTNTNTSTFTNTPVFTFTPTNTFTSTNTFTVTNTFTFTATPTVTNTPTNTFTFTPTPPSQVSMGKQVSEGQAHSGDILDYSIAVTVTGNSVSGLVVTDTLPANVTFTAFNPSNTISGTYTPSTGLLQWIMPSPLAVGVYTLSYQTTVNNFVPANTVVLNKAVVTGPTIAPINSSAPVTVVGEFTVKVNVYNSAGEVVKTILVQVFSQPVNNITLSTTNMITTLNGPGSIIDIFYNGYLIGTWNGTNNLGQPVSNGSYSIQVDNLSQNGVVTSVAQTAMVNRSLANISANVYNESGELIRTLYNVVSDPLGSSMTNVTLSSNIFRPSLTASTTGSSSTVANILIETSASPVTLTWDGANNGGSIVTPGVYTIEVHWNNGSGQTSDITREIVVMPPVGISGIVVARPNVLNATNGMTTTFDATGISNASSLKIRIYTVAGELVQTILSSTPTTTWSAAGLASGIYIANVEIDNASGGVVSRPFVKLLVLH